MTRARDLRAKAERVLDGTQTGRYTKRQIARDLIAAADALVSIEKAIRPLVEAFDSSLAPAPGAEGLRRLSPVEWARLQAAVTDGTLAAYHALALPEASDA